MLSLQTYYDKKSMIKITLPDGSIREYAKGTTPLDVIPTFLAVCTGSPVRVPIFTCWQLTAGVALVIGLNLTPHGTS